MSPLRIAIAGLGVVGSEVARQLTHRQLDLALSSGRVLQLVAVSARSTTADRGFSMDHIDWHDNAIDLASRDDVDVIIEMIGGSEGVAVELTRTALKNGKHVITANKAMIAHHGTELASLAEAHNCYLLFESAVAGGIPAVKTLREGLAGNDMSRIAGILNGTCNFILTTMEQTGEDFADVLAKAQRLGYAEAEPSFDVDGIDAAHKLTILAAIAFGQKPDFAAASIQGIRDVSAVDFAFANQLGFRIKLVGVATPGQMPRMQTCLLPLNSQLAKVNGVLNAVEFYGEPIGSVIAIGPGAGGEATSSAVLSDIIDVAHDRGGMPFGRPVAQLVDSADQVGAAPADLPFYVRLMIVDESGVLAGVTGILQKHKISVESLIQQGRAPG
ncbi:MAG: homoserine dehydrogenase, partial [Pseudomonadota bacterium]|nr:homoserine dehydrogenase [Pseudomonadota bacterium]